MLSYGIIIINKKAHTMPGRRFGDFAEWFTAHDWYHLPDGSYARALPRSREDTTWTLVSERPQKTYSIQSNGIVFVIRENNENSTTPVSRIQATFDASDIQDYT